MKNKVISEYKQVFRKGIELSKIDANQLKINKSTCNVNKIADSLYFQYALLFANSRVKLIVKKSLNDADSYIKTIRKFNDKTPIIALTAYAMSEDRIFALNAGCNDYIVKPLTDSTLYDMLVQYI